MLTFQSKGNSVDKLQPFMHYYYKSFTFWIKPMLIGIGGLIHSFCCTAVVFKETELHIKKFDPNVGFRFTNDFFYHDI